jgi:two-component system, chemotaxis family, protein-glutamate methylesterase/glutaminase
MRQCGVSKRDVAATRLVSLSAERSEDPFAVVAMAASAGGLAALSRVLGALPRDFPVPIVVVQHLDRRHRSLMAEILGRRTALSVRQAEEGDELTPGVVFIAPPDNHVLVNGDNTLSLSRSELVHFVRPSADLLFESAAAAYRNRAIGVVLTGTGVDGSVGAKAFNATGGTLIAQDEESSEFFGMPAATIDAAHVDFVLGLDEIAPALLTLVGMSADEARVEHGDL